VGTGSAFYGENPGYEGNGGLNKLNKETGKFIRYMHDEKDTHSLIDNRIRAIFEDSRGNFWVGTAGDGLHTMDRSKGTFERHLYDSTHPYKLSRPRAKNVYSYGVDHITFITEDANGRIWIGTFGGGINVYDPSNQKVVHYGTDTKSKEQIADNEFWTAYKTKDNVLWISTWHTNLYKVSPYQVVLPHTHVGKIVFCFAEDDELSLWIGTDRGLIHKFNTGKEEQFLCDKDSSSLTNRIYYIERDNSKLWFTGNNILYLFDPATKHMERYRHQPGNTNSLRSDTVYTVKKGYANKLWIGGPGGLDMLDTKSGVFTHVPNKLNDGSTISNTSIYYIFVDKKQNVWAITNEGLNRLDEQTGRFKKYLDRTPVNFVTGDREGNLWCTTYQGVFKYDQEADNFLKFTDESGLINTPSFWMDEDNEQNIWIAGLAGIIRLDKDRKNAVLFGKNQAVNVGTLTGAPFIRRNGEILVGDSTGFFEIKSGLFQKQSSPSFVNITISY
jgi:ligand-binding sensor domain-containing protein